MRSTRVMTALAGALLAVLLLSCGFRNAVNQAAQQSRRQNDLKQIGLAYHNYVDTNNKAPTKADDLIPGLFGSPGPIGMLQDGSVVFLYGVSIQDMTVQAGTGNTIIAYESKVPTQGGLVLLGDASVQTVTPAIFNGLTLAKPAPKDEKKDDKTKPGPKDEKPKKDDKPKVGDNKVIEEGQVKGVLKFNGKPFGPAGINFYPDIPGQDPEPGGGEVIQRWFGRQFQDKNAPRRTL